MGRSRVRTKKLCAAEWPGEGVLMKERDAACVRDDISSRHMLDGESRAPIEEERTGPSMSRWERKVWQRRHKRLRGRLRETTGMGMTGFLELPALQLKQVAWTASSKLRVWLGCGGFRVDLRSELAVPTARACILCRIDSRCLVGGPTGPLDSVGRGDDSKADRALSLGIIATSLSCAEFRGLLIRGGVPVVGTGDADARSVAPAGELVLSCGVRRSLVGLGPCED